MCFAAVDADGLRFLLLLLLFGKLVALPSVVIAKVADLLWRFFMVDCVRSNSYVVLQLKGSRHHGLVKSLELFHCRCWDWDDRLRFRI